MLPHRWLLNLAVIPFLFPCFSQAQIDRSPLTLSLGAFTLFGGKDILVLYHRGQGPWGYGFRYLDYDDTFEDPFTGRDLTDDEHTLAGPVIYYLLDDIDPGSFYLGGALYQHSLRVTTLIYGESDKDSKTSPFFGGGYFGRLGDNGFYNIGIFVSFGGKLTTETSYSYDEESGIDTQVMLGYRF